MATKRKGNTLTTADKATVKSIDDTAKLVYDRISQIQKPELKFPQRSLANVTYDRKVGHFKLGRARKERTLTVNTVKNFAQTLKLMALSKQMVLEDDFATKREAYYVSKNWGEAKFKEQPESDSCMDDIEALASLDGLSREQLRFYPEEHGGSVAGNLALTVGAVGGVYIAGGMAFVALMLTLFGFDGLIIYLLLCGHAQLQLLLSDYVQHYGLLRKYLPSGALEPAGLQHSWDAPHPFSGLVMLNAPRHADHHAHPSRPYPELRLSPKGRAPLLPYSLPVMATIALVPPLWHRVMDKRISRLRALAAKA